MGDSLESRLDTVYKTSGDRARLDNAYDDWARDYDQDIWASGNPYFTLIAGLAGRYITDRKARILDGGCGTGLQDFLSVATVPWATEFLEGLVALDAVQKVSDGILEVRRGFRDFHFAAFGILGGGEN